MSAALMQRASLASASASRPHAAPRATAVQPQAFFVAPRRYSSCYRPSPYRSAPLVTGMLGTMLASEWLNRSVAPQLPVHIHTAEEAYTLSADVPGMGDEDVNVEVTPEGVLSISGNRQAKHAPRTQQPISNNPSPGEDFWVRAESASPSTPSDADSEDGSSDSASTTSSDHTHLGGKSSSSSSSGFRFSRSFVLPEDVDADAISADLDRGVLTVTLPRRVQPKPQPKRVNIRKGGSSSSSA